MVVPPAVEVMFTACAPAYIPAAGLNVGASACDGLIVTPRIAVPMPPALAALIVILEVPVTVGVPVINPVEVFTLSHPGRPSAAKLVGVLLAVIW
jgi:hypothetical protein